MAPQRARRLFTSALAVGLWATCAAAAAPKPETLPDWVGTWQNLGAPENNDLFDGSTGEPHGCTATRPPCREHPPYNKEWEAKYTVNLARALAGTMPDPLTKCYPRQTPGNMRTPETIEWVVRPEMTVIFVEDGSHVRRIFTDGRKHRTGKGGFLSFSGDSIGHWEGDTLVVETTNVLGEQMLDRSGAMVSSKAVFNERMRRLGPNQMEDIITINDPTSLTKPWVVRRLYKKVNGDIYDYACSENNRAKVDAEGTTHLLKPDGQILK